MGTTLMVTAKGQVTLRKELLRHLGVSPGDKVVVDFLPDGRAELRAAVAPASIEEFIGCKHALEAAGFLKTGSMEAQLAVEAWTKYWNI